jgi:hypothetical protein
MILKIKNTEVRENAKILGVQPKIYNLLVYA